MFPFVQRLMNHRHFDSVPRTSPFLVGRRCPLGLSCVIVAAVFAILCGNAFSQSAPKLLPFQGRLTDPSGLAVSNGVRLVQFKIYDVPTGGSSAWAGEVHKTTVNGGLVNVLLGSKTPFTGVDFDKTLYLEITVDINGDSAITVADPPMLPRQIILPAVFAKESADSRLLVGSDWTPIFGTNSPAGTLLPTKIAPNSINGAQIVSNSITSGQIAYATITSNQVAVAGLNGTNIALGSISGDRLTPSTITGAMIAVATLTRSNVVARQVGTNVSGGGMALSGSSGNPWTSPSPNARTVVPALDVTLQTFGGPVFVGLTPSAESASVDSMIEYGGQSSASFVVELVRNGVVVRSMKAYEYYSTDMIVTPSLFNFVDTPPAGMNHYQVAIWCKGGGANVLRVYAVCLFAFEL